MINIINFCLVFNRSFKTIAHSKLLFIAKWLSILCFVLENSLESKQGKSYSTEALFKFFTKLCNFDNT